MEKFLVVCLIALPLTAHGTVHTITKKFVSYQGGPVIVANVSYNDNELDQTDVAATGVAAVRPPLSADNPLGAYIEFFAYGSTPIHLAIDSVVMNQRKDLPIHPRYFFGLAQRTGLPFGVKSEVLRLTDPVIDLAIDGGNPGSGLTMKTGEGHFEDNGFLTFVPGSALVPDSRCDCLVKRNDAAQLELFIYSGVADVPEPTVVCAVLFGGMLALLAAPRGRTHSSFLHTRQ